LGPRPVVVVVAAATKGAAAAAEAAEVDEAARANVGPRQQQHEQEHRDAEYAKKHETRIGPTCSIEGFSFVLGLHWSHAVNPGVRLL
jgi:Ni/Co efflux regulator RcnB